MAEQLFNTNNIGGKQNPSGFEGSSQITDGAPALNTAG